MSDTTTNPETETEEVKFTAKETSKVNGLVKGIADRNRANFDADLAAVREVVAIVGPEGKKLSTRDFAERFNVSQTEAQNWYAAAKLDETIVQGYRDACDAAKRKSRSISALIAYNRALGSGDGDGDETPDPWVKKPAKVTGQVKGQVHEYLVKMLTKAGYTPEHIADIFAYAAE